MLNLLDDIRREMKYDPTTGILSWAINNFINGHKRIDKPLGCKDFQTGYIQVRYKGRKLYAHRIAWFLYYGIVPTKGMHIDHIDGNGFNNKITNLQELTVSQNVAKGYAAKRKKALTNAGVLV